MGFPILFLDTACVAEIRQAAETGLVHGIATNPDKLRQSGLSMDRFLREVRGFFDGPIAFQALGRTVEEICDCARKIHQKDPQLAVKVAVNEPGLAAVRILVSEGIRTNATLIFTPSQGLLAGLLGSPFISPFVGRARMSGLDGIETIRQIRQLYDRLHIDRTCIIAASIKDSAQAIEALLAGAHSLAVPFRVFEAMCQHPMTEQGLSLFTEASRSPGKAS